MSGILVLSLDVTAHLALKREREALYEHATRDPLTSLFNRRFMKDLIEEHAVRAMRENSVFSLIMLDIDRFKSFNDRFDHAAGDEVLQAVADARRSSIREADVACRFAGDEMVAVLPGVSPPAALTRAETIRAAVASARIAHHGQRVGPVTVSLGVASFPRDGLSADEILRAANRALYQAKHDGRNRVRLSTFPPSDSGSRAGQASATSRPGGARTPEAPGDR